MARRNPLIAALLLAVLLGHAVLLQWLAWQAQEHSALRQMTTPMFTRLLQQRAPVQVAAPAAAPVKARPRRVPAVVQAVEPSTPQQATVTVADATAPRQSEPLPTSPSLEPAPPTPVDATPAGSTPASSATSTTTALDSWPADTRLSYRVGGFFRGELHGTARVQWQREGERYQTRIDIDLGLVGLVMTSQGTVTPQGLAPQAYEENRTGKRRSVLLKDKLVVLSEGNQVPRPDGVQDTASQFVELSHRFASGQLPLEVGRSVSFWMARPGGVDFWTYDVADKEVLQTPQLGPVEAFHLKPRPIVNPRGNITAEMWFAPTLQYLPVRIRVDAGEAHLDLVIDRIEQR